MSFTVFLGNLPAWVTADDIRGWLAAESLVADAIKVIRNPETQESKGFAFIDAPNAEEMASIIRRFDRAPLEDRMLRANPAQPPKPRASVRPAAGPGSAGGPERPGGHGGYGRPPRQFQPQGPPQSHGPAHGQTHGASHVTTHGPSQDAGQEHASHSGPNRMADADSSHGLDQGSNGPNQGGVQGPPVDQRPPRRGKRAGSKKPGTGGGPSSAFAEELAKAL